MSSDRKQTGLGAFFKSDNDRSKRSLETSVPEEASHKRSTRRASSSAAALAVTCEEQNIAHSKKTKDASTVVNSINLKKWLSAGLDEHPVFLQQLPCFQIVLPLAPQQSVEDVSIPENTLDLVRLYCVSCESWVGGKTKPPDKSDLFTHLGCKTKVDRTSASCRASNHYKKVAARSVKSAAQVAAEMKAAESVPACGLVTLFKQHGKDKVVAKIKQLGTILSLLQSGRPLLDAGRERQLQAWLGVPNLSSTHWAPQQVWGMVDAIDAYLIGVFPLHDTFSFCAGPRCAALRCDLLDKAFTV
jgi:hypothetical protein